MRILFVLIFFKIASVFGQNWSFTETRQGRNVPFKLIETYDKGIIFSVFEPTIFRDIYLYKLDINGNLYWKRNYYYNSENAYFETTSILRLKEGGYILVGATTLFDTVSEGNPFILKLNECFEPEWFKIYNKPLA